MEAVVDETREIRALSRQLAADELRPHTERWDHDAAFDDSVLAHLAELGFLGMRIPDLHGGMGLGVGAWGAAVEELAWGDPGVALTLVQASQAADLLAAAGSAPAAAAWLPKLAAGEATACVAVAEEGAGSDLAAAGTRAVPQDGGWRISGDKRWVTNPTRAGLAIVLAAVDAGPTLFAVPTTAAGWSIGPRDHTLGLRSIEIASVRLADVSVGSGAVLGRPGQAMELLAATADAHRFGVAATATGIARAALEHAVDYASEREQFGRPIREFQGMQFKLADMATRLAAAEALLSRALAEPTSERAAMAKIFASETAMWVTTQAVQVFGGYGYMRDYPVEKLMRDAKATELLGSANELLRVAIAESLGRS